MVRRLPGFVGFLVLLGSIIRTGDVLAEAVTEPGTGRSSWGKCGRSRFGWKEVED